MTGNRLIERRPAKQSAGDAPDHCPNGYSDPHAWCAWRNREKNREDILWVVGPNGTPIIVDDEAVMAERHRKDKAVKDEEARRHNWRIMHPIDGQQEAAE